MLSLQAEIGFDNIYLYYILFINTVNAACIKFKVEFKDALGGIRTKKEDLVIIVDDLVLKLQNKFPRLR